MIVLVLLLFLFLFFLLHRLRTNSPAGDAEQVELVRIQARQIVRQDMRRFQVLHKSFLEFIEWFSPADIPGTHRGDAALLATGTVAPELREMWDDMLLSPQ